MEINEWWQAGIIQDKRACDVLWFSFSPPTRESPGPPGHQPSARPARYLTAAMQGSSPRSTTQHRPRHRPHRTQNSNIQPPSLINDPGGMTPAQASLRRRITSAVAMGVGLLPVLECHHGHGRARRRPLLFDLWPLACSAAHSIYPATSSLLPVWPRPPDLCLSSGAVV